MPEGSYVEHFEFVTSINKIVVPRVLNREILPIIAKYRDKLKKEFDEL